MQETSRLGLVSQHPRHVRGQRGGKEPQGLRAGLSSAIVGLQEPRSCPSCSGWSCCHIPGGAQRAASILAGRFCTDPLPPSPVGDPPRKAGGPGRPKPQPPEFPKHSRHSLSPQTLCQPLTPCATRKLARSLCYSFYPLSSGSPVCVWCLHPRIPGYCRPHSWCFPSPADIFLPVLLPWAGSGLAPKTPPVPAHPCEPTDGKDTSPSLGREISHRMPAEGGMGMEGREIALIALGES